MKKSKNKITVKLNYGLQIVLVGALTGLSVGLVATLYAALDNLIEEFTHGYYGFFRDNSAFIPLLFLALAAGGIVIGGVLRFLPMIRGNGIPLTEGAARGVVRYKWYQILPAMFASSLFCVFMGLASGGEGPSVAMGGACGYGVSNALKRNATVRRYQITGGACAGLAVASNAPLTGMAFAFEEAHKRFTPEVFTCAFSSVIVALITRNLLAPFLGLSTGAAFSTFVFNANANDPLFYVYAFAAAVVCSLAAVGFYYLLVLLKRLFKKFTLWKGMGKMTVPFLLAGVFGLITGGAIGGGHEFIDSLGSGSEGVERVFSSPLWVTLLIIVVLRLIATAVNAGAELPCGIFVPMIAVGAGIGALMSELFAVMGMDAAYRDTLVVICMAVFFTAAVKAPITGIVMTMELTWSFTYLLPAIIGVAVGYVLGGIFHTKPLYDMLLDEMLEESEATAVRHSVCVRLRVKAGSLAKERAVRDVLWPAGARITVLEHLGKNTVPDGNSVLMEGDILTVTGETADEEDFLSLLVTAVGELVEEETEEPQEEQTESQETQ
ncbi:MAG: chloride channel protein [Clostridia bacterium]|nr:chloride channel protein [Clostridia bacterium]